MKVVAPDGTVHTQHEFDFMNYGIIVFGCSAESGDTVTVGGQKYMLTRGKWVEVN